MRKMKMIIPTKTRTKEDASYRFKGKLLTGLGWPIYLMTILVIDSVSQDLVDGCKSWLVPHWLNLLNQLQWDIFNLAAIIIIICSDIQLFKMNCPPYIVKSTAWHHYHITNCTICITVQNKLSTLYSTKHCTNCPHISTIVQYRYMIMFKVSTVIVIMLYK